MNPFRSQEYPVHRFERVNNLDELQQEQRQRLEQQQPQEQQQQQQQRQQQQRQQQQQHQQEDLAAFELQRQLLAVHQLRQQLHQRGNRLQLNQEQERDRQRHRERELREPLIPRRGGGIAERLRRHNQIYIERFMLSMRIILQRQSVHFDIGGGDGILVWSWRRPTSATGQLGQGDGDGPDRWALRQVLPTL